MDNNSNILIIGNLHSNPSAQAFLQKFVNIISKLVNQVYVISGDKPPLFENVVWIKIEYKERSGYRNYIAFLNGQINLIKKIISINDFKYEKVIILPTSFLFPLIFFKLMRKKVGLFVAQKLENKLLNIFININFKLSDKIIVESNNVENIWNLEKYDNKVVNGGVYVDTEIFKNSKNIENRDCLVAYIGLFDDRKGIRQLIDAIKLNQRKEIKFVFAGMGKLEYIVKDIYKKNENVEYLGIVDNKDLPQVFNEAKLLVLPSKSEGLPNIILEAMACGTVVLSTKVGGIPDIVKDGVTGFLMEDISANTILENINRALYDANLKKISLTSQKFVNKDYSLDSAIERYKVIINGIQ